MSHFEKKFLLHALALATTRQGFCAPNPSVGAVVVRDQKIIGEGFHFAAGYPHAEVMALQEWSPADLKNACLYVTLEPCCMHGRTPPCTDLIIQKGISKVIYGYQDPDERVAGKGALQLKKAGIDCEQQECAEVTDFYHDYAYWKKTNLPWVVAKIALSQDYKIAGKQKIRAAISGGQANIYTHTERLKADAILTTAETVLQDDPAMNVRVGEEIIAKPVILLDRALKTPHAAKIFKTAEKIFIFHDTANTPLLSEKNIHYVPISITENGQLNLVQVITAIGALGFYRVFAEVGAILLQSLLSEKKMNELIVYQSKKISIPNGYAASFLEHFLQTASSIKKRDTTDDVIKTFFIH